MLIVSKCRRRDLSIADPSWHPLASTAQRMWQVILSIGRRANMRTSSVFVGTALALILMPIVFAADELAWGQIINGLRLGAAFGSDPSRPTLRIELQNVGLEFLDVVIGHEAGGMIYDSL